MMWIIRIFFMLFFINVVAGVILLAEEEPKPISDMTLWEFTVFWVGTPTMSTQFIPNQIIASIVACGMWFVYIISLMRLLRLMPAI